MPHEAAAIWKRKAEDGFERFAHRIAAKVARPGLESKTEIRNSLIVEEKLEVPKTLTESREGNRDEKTNRQVESVGELAELQDELPDVWIPADEAPAMGPVLGGGRVERGIGDQESEAIVRVPQNPNDDPQANPNNTPVVSTNARPSLVLIRHTPVRIESKPENLLQQELIDSPLVEWKTLKDPSKPPLPDKHVVNPSGKKKFGRRTLTGYEILRKVRCVCGGERRLTAGYISATQLHDMRGEDYETQVGIVRQILRKRAREIDGKLDSVRCAACCTGSSAQSQGVA